MLAQLHSLAMDPSHSDLLRSLVLAILSASIWTLLRSRKRSVGPSLHQIPGPRRSSWWKGNQGEVRDLKEGWDFHKMLADVYGPVVRLQSFLWKEEFYTYDPKAMHHILVKDASFFIPRRMESGNILLGNGLLGTIGEHHRKQRKMLNPVFSIAHMRSMMPVFYDIVDQLETTLDRKVKDGPQEIDLLGWMARTALELIGQSGFGYSFDSLEEDVPKHKYSIIIKDLVPKLSKLSIPSFFLLPLAVKLFSAKVRTVMMNMMPWKALHEVRDMVNYMHDFSVQVYEDKKRALEQGEEAVVQQVGRGKDLLSIMLRENMKADSEDRLDEEELISQISTFTFAAMDTTSNGMSRILHLLSTHTDVQDKLRQEIVDARKERQGAHLTYDDLVALPYLDAICRETLRLHPPVSNIIRKSTEDMVVPFSDPVRGVDGSEITEVLLPKNTAVTIAIMNSNRNPTLWGPDALEWKPERWLSPLPGSIMDAKIPGVYSHLMTFSGGTRSCIGFKFSQLEMKAVISILVENFKFSPAPGKDIFWQMSGITSPVVVNGDGHASLPLIVESAK